MGFERGKKNRVGIEDELHVAFLKVNCMTLLQSKKSEAR